MNDKKILIKGKGSVGVAIAYFSLRGMVSIPLEPCEYNLIFDDYTKISRIKVISCSYKSPYGIYTVSIRNMGGNMPKQTVKTFNDKTCDFVFIVTDELDIYNIPANKITSKRQISLNVYADYKVLLA